LIQFDSPDDGHWVARNMKRSEINKYIEKIAINKNYTEMHGQRNIKCYKFDVILTVHRR